MKYKILAVDDNSINTKLLARALVNSEYQILTAGSGREALKVALSELPDIILLDVMMDDMDGYAVCTELQNHPDTKYIPVIFLSAKNESVDKAKGLALGAVDYLTKPFDPVEINARVRTHLSIRKKTILLQRENKKLREQTDVSDTTLTEKMGEIQRTHHQIKTKGISFSVSVKSSKIPVTSLISPLAEINEGLLFLLFNGFKKDLSTMLVQLLVEEFSIGFARGYSETGFSSAVLQELVTELMQRFSPDVHGVAFSFAVGWLDISTHSLSYYAFQQKPPLCMDTQGNCSQPDLETLAYNGPFADLIRAHKIVLDPDVVFCFYRLGVSNVLPELYRKMFSASLKKYNQDIIPSLSEIVSDLPLEEQDQLVCLFSLS